MQGELRVVYLSLHTPAARELRGRWQLRFTPTYILFDAGGREVWRGVRLPSQLEVRALLAAP
jgi:hypothetical protein